MPRTTHTSEQECQYFPSGELRIEVLENLLCHYDIDDRLY